MKSFREEEFRAGSAAADFRPGGESFPVVLAPMAGLTSSAFRLVCRESGCCLSFTELVSAEGIRREAERSLAYLHTLPGEAPVGAHLFGADPQAFADAARVVAASGRFALIDINCGCPVRKVVRRGAGAALLKNPGLVGDIVAATREASGLPVTLKTRLGPSPGSFVLPQVLDAAERAGASAVFVHGRYASSFHRGPADLAAVARAGVDSPLPVFANGGLDSPAAAVAQLEHPGLAGVMIGRGAVGNPWIFSGALRLRMGKAVLEPGAEEILAVLSRHLNLEIAHMRRLARKRGQNPQRGELLACRAFLPHLSGYLRGRPGARDFRRTFMEKVRTGEDLLSGAALILRG